MNTNKPFRDPFNCRDFVKDKTHEELAQIINGLVDTLCFFQEGTGVNPHDLMKAVMKSGAIKDDVHERVKMAYDLLQEMIQEHARQEEAKRSN